MLAVILASTLGWVLQLLGIALLIAVVLLLIFLNIGSRRGTDDPPE